jgi:hypothetical protein
MMQQNNQMPDVFTFRRPAFEVLGIENLNARLLEAKSCEVLIRSIRQFESIAGLLDAGELIERRRGNVKHADYLKRLSGQVVDILISLSRTKPGFYRTSLQTQSLAGGI